MCHRPMLKCLRAPDFSRQPAGKSASCRHSLRLAGKILWREAEWSLRLSLIHI